MSRARQTSSTGLDDARQESPTRSFSSFRADWRESLISYSLAEDSPAKCRGQLVAGHWPDTVRQEVATESTSEHCRDC